MSSSKQSDEEPIVVPDRLSSPHPLTKQSSEILYGRQSDAEGLVHTLRKTWGYHQRVTFGVDLPRLMVCFNHSTQRQTLDYLCIQPQEIKDVYENEL